MKKAFLFIFVVLILVTFSCNNSTESLEFGTKLFEPIKESDQGIYYEFKISDDSIFGKFYQELEGVYEESNLVGSLEGDQISITHYKENSQTGSLNGKISQMSDGNFKIAGNWKRFRNKKELESDIVFNSTNRTFDAEKKSNSKNSQKRVVKSTKSKPKPKPKQKKKSSPKIILPKELTTNAACEKIQRLRENMEFGTNVIKNTTEITQISNDLTKKESCECDRYKACFGIYKDYKDVKNIMQKKFDDEQKKYVRCVEDIQKEALSSKPSASKKSNEVEVKKKETILDKKKRY